MAVGPETDTLVPEGLNIVTVLVKVPVTVSSTFGPIGGGQDGIELLSNS